MLYMNLPPNLTAISRLISKMDATANDVDYDGMSLSGYPTLYFFDGKSKKPKLMDSWSDLNVESFKSFLKKEAATPYDEGKLKSYEKIVQKEEENDQPMAVRVRVRVRRSCVQVRE